MRASNGLKRGTRRKLKRNAREKITIERLVKAFKPGEKVIIALCPYSNRGLPHPKYSGYSGMIKGARGSSYVVAVMKGNQKREIIVAPEHLKTAGD